MIRPAYPAPAAARVERSRVTAGAPSGPGRSASEAVQVPPQPFLIFGRDLDELQRDAVAANLGRLGPDGASQDAGHDIHSLRRCQVSPDEGERQVQLHVSLEGDVGGAAHPFRSDIARHELQMIRKPVIPVRKDANLKPGQLPVGLSFIVPVAHNAREYVIRGAAHKTAVRAGISVVADRSKLLLLFPREGSLLKGRSRRRVTLFPSDQVVAHLLHDPGL